MKPFLITVFLFSLLPAGAQSTPWYLRVGAYDTVQTGFRALVNPAALADAKKKSAGLYGEQRFLLEELSSYQGSVVLPMPAGSFALTGTYSGTADYQETGVGIAYGRKLHETIGVGLQFFYRQQHTASYGTIGTGSIGAGVQFRFTGALTMGVQVSYPLTGISKISLLHRMIYTMAFSYRPSGQLLLQAELIKEAGQPFTVHGAARYAFEKRMHVTLGTATGTSTFYFGGGVLLQHLGIDAFLSCHPALGLTPGLLLSYTLP